ncbi:restriction endonuclease subunit S [Aulosira sp. FACHB-615]|uniref:restriction endonuclease subunit S n=1 Tax=Aulosira sp. FACHB-615 TaxID=2692777 RepID=UPI001685D4C3|nr:restriction endonuclease subunit S [Aulosira sp. FACHB-615]MBD2487605.1 restriction endonuclease subunit S [Aulosira sp. FACHB-615]
MKLETFFENFELLTDAPKAVSTLQKIILQLAVMGKLVPNNTNDSQVPLKLEEFVDKKNRNKNIAQLKNDEYPFYVHINWQWQRLNNLGKTQTGTTPATSNPDFYGNDYSFIKPADISFSDIRYNVEGLSEEGVKNGRLVPKNSVLMVSIGGSIGKVGLVDRDCSCNQQINYITLKEQILPKLIYYFLKSPYFQQQVLLLAPTTTMPILSKGKWDTIPIPVPPLAEQKRIVEKCDRLLSICDEIEKRQQQRQDSILRMNESAIAQLLSSQNPDDFCQHWQRICNNFDLLYSVPETIPKLRQAILQLAVQGKLVRQDPNDEPAQELLNKIKSDQDKSLPSISSEEIPFDLPHGWIFARLGNLIEPSRDITYGIIKLGLEPTEDGVKTLRCSDILYRRINNSNIRSVTRDLSEQYSRTIIQGGELLMNIRGTLGGCAIATEEYKGCNIAREVAMIPISHHISNLYILDVISSPFIQIKTMQNLRGIAYKGLNLNLLRMFVIPLPPLAEQKRIVEKCDRLMSLCDTLEAKLKQGRDSSEKLMEVAAKQVLTA